MTAGHIDRHEASVNRAINDCKQRAKNEVDACSRNALRFAP
jgi:hypothetical protein